MTNRIVSWNPFEKHQFVLNGAKLELLEVSNINNNDESMNDCEQKLNLKPIDSVEPYQLSCVDWHPCEETSLLAYGTSQGEVHLKNWQKPSEVSVFIPPKNVRRSCNSLAWNKQISTQLAAGFECVKSEFCAIVWDFEHQKFQRVSTGESVTTMTWLPDSAHLLVTGTAIGWVRVHDIRSGSQHPAISFMAHPGPRPRKVKGIRSDPFHHNVFATFSDGAGDVVRLWDLRRHYSSTPKNPMSHLFTVVPSSGSAVVQDAAWSPARPHILATATSGQRSVSFFSTNPQHNQEGVTSTPLFHTACLEPVRSLSWRGLDARHVETFNAFGTVFDLDLNTDKESAERARIAWETFKLDETLQHMPFDFFAESAAVRLDECKVFGDDGVHLTCPFNSLLVATSNGVLNVEVKDRAALAVSTGGVVATGQGEALQLTDSGCSAYPQSIGEDTTVGCLNNTSNVMQYRAVQGYSIDESKNLEVLAGELDHIYSSIHALVANSSSDQNATKNSNTLNKLSQTAGNILEVYKVYVWADRFEALTNQTNLSLVNCGVLDIIQNETRVTDQLQQNYRCLFHNTLGADVYLSKSRFLCKKICGWIGVLGLEKGALRSSVEGGEDEEEDEGLLEVIVSECLDGFERAAAMALWHGDINLAVHVLHRAIDRHETSKMNPPVSASSAPVAQPLTTKLSMSPLSLKQGGANNDMSPFDDDDSNTPLPRDYRHGEEDEESNIDWDREVSDDYMKLVSLVGMCLAGYNHASCCNHKSSPSHSGRGGSTSSSTTTSAWASMCKHVLSQLQHSTRRATSYLVACCVFLLTNINEFGADDYLLLYKDSSSVDTAKYGIRVGYRAIVEDTRMLLEDRIAFAATFFANNHAVDWFTRVRDSRKQSGRLDGILITGLSTDGLDILQQYVDRFEDIQTVALLVSRIIESTTLETKTDTSRPTREWIWLHEYRNLLNKWGLFIERAKLDVELGKRYRSHSAVTSAAKKDGIGMASKGGRGGMPFKGSSKPQQYPFSKSGHQSQQQDRSKRIMYKLSPHSDFPHIYLRCSYCGTSLPVDGMQTNKAESLRSQKSVLNCCAGCSKQLPRCYVCQLYMGMVNPYRELNRTMTKKRFDADNRVASSSIAASSGETSRVSPRGTDNVAIKKPTSIGVIEPAVEVHAPSSASHHSSQMKSDHNVIDFDRWFFFCQHCRHGGHATCIDQWFGGGNSTEEGRAVNDFNSLKATQRIVCGVNGCNCNCKARK